MYKINIIENREYYKNPEGAIKSQHYKRKVWFLGILIYNRVYDFESQIVDAGINKHSTGFKTNL